METNNLPKITVVTVVFNGELSIEQTIKSVLEQSYKNVEYIIVDGGSNDRTMELVKGFESNIDIIVSEQDQGIYDAMNKALKLASGSWISFMNCGDTFFNRTIIADIFDGNHYDKYALLYGDVCFLNDGNDVVFRSEKNSRSININPVCHQSVFVRVSEHPEFINLYRLCADHNLIYKFFKKNKCHYLDLIVSTVELAGASSDVSLTRKEKMLISWREGDLYDAFIGVIAYVYNFLKQHVKVGLLKCLPDQIFRKLQKIKFLFEQKL